MRAEHINPFIQAATEVLTEVIGGPVTRGELKVASSPVISNGVSTIIGMAGEVEGRVIYDMDKKTAIKIASIMNEEEQPGMNSLVRSTISELSNMITGKATSILHSRGFRFSISPPAMFTGKDMEISDESGFEILVIPLETKCGNIIINVAMRSSEKK